MLPDLIFTISLKFDNHLMHPRYTVFCRTFASGGTAKISDIFIMILVLLILFCCLAVISWACLKLFFAKEPKLQVMGLFGCLQKTVSRGDSGRLC